MVKRKIAIVGGGVAGSTLALYLGELGLDITLFEKKESLSSGPPYCHLHAGGNLYREISDTQCVTLLKQSIDFAKYYPFIVDYRPTVIAVPLSDKGSPLELLPRLALLQKEYSRLIEEDTSNAVLGESKDYYKLYSKEAVESLRKLSIVKKPTTHDEWMLSAIHTMDIEKIQYPLILVQEYGMNLFRFGAGVALALKALQSVKFLKNTTVTKIQKNPSDYRITYKDLKEEQNESFDYLINASGFKIGEIDNMLGILSKRMVEFKSSYITKWETKSDTIFPEIIFHGQRGTPQGMAQFTPYPSGYFQLHGMTHDVTLYKDGLVASTHTDAQPRLENHFIQKIDSGWNQAEIDTRTQNAIKHLTQFIPSFAKASVGSAPLFGAQQIPGDDPTLRVAEVSFPFKNYARCEIVKVSSTLDMVDAIVQQLIKLDYLKPQNLKRRNLNHLKNFDEKALNISAQELALSRGYPSELAKINVKKPK